MFQEENSLSHLRFPQKLWYLLNAQTDAILWGNMGRTILLNYNILDRYLQCNQSIFKTTHISSFIRQLNLYGFRKVTSHLQDPLCNASNPDLHEYVHDFFQYGKFELLRNIKRKAWNLKKIKQLDQSHTLKTTYNTNDIKMGRSSGSLRLRKARKMLQNALKRVTIPNFSPNCTVQDSQDESQMAEEIYEINLDTDLNIQHSQDLPWENNHSDCFFPPSENFHQNTIQANPSTSYIDSDIQDYGGQMNISAYIENFRVSDDFVGGVNNEMQDDSFFYTSHEITLENEEEVQLETYDPLKTEGTSKMSSDMIVVEILEGQDSKKNEQQMYQSEWPQYSINDLNITENEISLKKDTSNYSSVKEEHYDLENMLMEKPLESEEGDGPKIEYTERGEPWEYNEILKDIIAKKGFPPQEYGTELKELYTQISKTIDILNL